MTQLEAQVDALTDEVSAIDSRVDDLEGAFGSIQDQLVGFDVRITALENANNAGFPNAYTTGVPPSIDLDPATPDQDGNYVVNTTNAVVDGLEVEAGCFVVKAADVTIINSKARCIVTEGSAPEAPNPRLKVIDSEINCTAREGTQPTNSGISAQNVTVTRVEIHNCENGIYTGSNFTVEDSYIHHLYQCEEVGCPEPSPHTDGIQVWDPAGDNGVIEHNTIHGFTAPCVPGNGGTCNGTSAVMYNNVATGGDPPVENVTIHNNLLAGGSVALYCPQQAVDEFSVTDNHFSTIYAPKVGEFGSSTDCATSGGESQSGNVIHETGTALTLG